MFQSKAKFSSLQNNLSALYQLCDALCEEQITEPDEKNFGAIRCKCCGVLHTRAGEACFPLAVAYKYSGREKYLNRAVWLGNWLISQQTEEGFWYETPGKWRGTTTFQTLSLSAAYFILKKHLDARLRDMWTNSILRAADWLASVMNESFANINYLSATSASLAFAYKITRRSRHLVKARELAHIVINKINEDGFLVGEGRLEAGRRYGVDLGYNLDMSLGSLALFSLAAGDDQVKKQVVRALQTCLYFVYPDGSIDNSWGVRGYKWTTYGSKTAHGCQMAFETLADEDNRFMTASQLNLAYLRKMMRNGWVGYGPHSWQHDPSFVPCIYPTFTRAENLAFAIEYGVREAAMPPIPSQKKNWFKFFPTINVVLVRTENLMATITAYQYNHGRKDWRERTAPTGGCISNLWWDGYGLMQTSSQTVYERFEQMHMPVEDDLLPLTPRIDYHNEGKYYTNLYEINGKVSVKSANDTIATIVCEGELKSRDFETCGVKYSLTYEFFADELIKRIKLRCDPDQLRKITVVEPIVKNAETEFIQKSSHVVMIKTNNGTWEFKVLNGNGELLLGIDEEKYWCPFPSLECYPISIKLSKSAEITYGLRRIISEQK
mgnify:CR=1 FL=1